MPQKKLRVWTGIIFLVGVIPRETVSVQVLYAFGRNCKHTSSHEVSCGGNMMDLQEGSTNPNQDLTSGRVSCGKIDACTVPA